MGKIGLALVLIGAVLIGWDASSLPIRSAAGGA